MLLLAMLASPLEQFQILPVFSIRLGSFDFSFTNASLIIFIGLVLTIYLMYLLMKTDTSSYILPNRYQVFFETFYEMITEMLESNIGTRGQKYFPFVFVLFTFILVSNLIGLVPYSFTITSHLIVTLFLSTTVFIAVNIILFQNHGLHGWSLFLPPGTSLGLVPILVPIELVSHFFKVISLAVRLFANMMAGHTLLKVIAGFAWSMMVSGYFFRSFRSFRNTLLISRS
jgi:ATP synthase subunit 6